MYFPNVCIHVKIYTHKSLVGEILGSFNIYVQHQFMVAPMLISSTGGKGGGGLMEGEPNWLGKGEGAQQRRAQYYQRPHRAMRGRHEADCAVAINTHKDSLGSVFAAGYGSFEKL